MMDASQNISQVIDHLFRHESGKMVSLLTRIFGLHNLEMAEDVVQDTLLKALQQWPYSGVPSNPSGWLFQVAKNKALDVVRREKFTTKFAEDISQLLESEWSVATTMNELFLDTEIPDDQLRMIFTCCHPALPSESQIALTLKTLCGFSIAEIARAFLTNEAVINKRLYRAKQKIAEENIVFEIPTGPALRERLDNVLSSLYLLFNEGYNSTHSDRLIREDLLSEAMRLATLLTDHPAVQDPKVRALLALMCFHTARIPARLDDGGNLLLLKEQDRSLWDQTLIDRGNYYLNVSAEGEEISTYHVEAAIACMHVRAKTFEETDWMEINKLYDLLYTLQPTPIVALNRAIAIAQTQGPDAAIESIAKIPDRAQLDRYYLLPATLGELYLQKKDFPQALTYLEKAFSLTDSAVEKKFLQAKIEKIPRKTIS